MVSVIWISFLASGERIGEVKTIGIPFIFALCRTTSLAFQVGADSFLYASSCSSMTNIEVRSLMVANAADLVPTMVPP